MTLLADKRPEPRPDPKPPLVSPGPTLPAPDFDGPHDRMRGWIVAAVVTIIGAITRFTMLRYPTDAGTPVFDEKHYAPQAWQVLTGGGIEDNPAYGLVVHPPVGKQMMAIGEAIFGYNGWGWRFSSAVVGTLMILMVVRIVRRMARSTLVGAIAGVLLICDGVTFVSSRLGMLDIFLAFWVLAAVGCLVCDRDDVRRRMHRVATEGRIGDSAWGPRMGVRWWRFGAGVCLGLACGTKWSGVYFIVFFGLMCVGFDVAARRSYGVLRPWRGTAIRDVGPAVASLVLVPVMVYLGSFWAWFAGETSVDRHAVGNEIGTGGSYSFVPDSVRSLWYYSGNVLKFHEGLTNSAGNHHPWESKPWTWPMGLRPMLYYFADGDTVKGCGEASCVKAVMLIGTPAMWWLAVPMLAWVAWCAIVRRDWRYMTVLVAYGAAFLPWFATLDRQMYYFYAVALAPFMVMGFALVLGDILGSAKATAERRGTGLLVVSLYVALVIANFVWLWPILTAMPISDATWQNELWLPSWK